MPEKRLNSLNDLPDDIKADAHLVGIEPSERERSGSFFQLDRDVICAKSTQPGVEVMAIADAMDKYSWVKDLRWKLVSKEKDEFTKAVAEDVPRGYFLRALPGIETIYPLQACLFINQKNLTQKVHNIIIAEEGAKLHIITGCSISSSIKSGMHIGISEFYVKKNASITFTMIHNWQEEVMVRPRSAAMVEEGGVFINNYVCMKPVKDLQLYPTITLAGKNSRAVSSSIVLGKKKSKIDMGTRIVLKAEGARAEIISRSVAMDESNIMARGHLIGEVDKVKAHLECRGLILSPKASISAIPELDAKAQDLDMSHEAAVGKIAEREILYLMSRGLTQDEATSAIVRGFLKIDIQGLPEKLKNEIDKISDLEFNS